MYVKEQRIFGPRSNQPHFQGNPIQRGQGIGSLLGKLGRSIGSIASKGVKIGKKFLKSDFAKEVGSSLLDQGVNAATEIISNVIDPNKESNPVEEAQSRLKTARSEIAEIIRQKKNNKKRKKKPIYDSSSEESDDEIVPLKKGKGIKIETKAKKKHRKHKKYNIFEDVE